MAKSKRRIRLSRKTARADTDDTEATSHRRAKASEALPARGTSVSALNLPGQSAPIDRAYLRLVLGHKARPPRTVGSPPLPEAYRTPAGDYLLELTAFRVGADAT